MQMTTRRLAKFGGFEIKTGWARHHLGGGKWRRVWFDIHYEPDQVSGHLYAGVTLFGVSFVHHPFM